MLPLFDKPQIGSLPREEFSHRLRRLAGESIFIGTSSWKYPGWLGSVYTDDRYRGRSRFSESKSRGKGGAVKGSAYQRGEGSQPKAKWL